MPEHDVEARLRSIITGTLERRESGDPVSDEEVLAAHPDLADLLSERLKQLALVATARKLAESSCEETISIASNGPERSERPEPTETTRAGQKIRHYVLEEQIGVGGFGTVWRARDSKLDCDVAVKIPRRELSPEDTDRFVHEARVSAQLRKHPNIVSVHEADWETDTAFIVSDYVDGASLDDRLDQSRVPFNEVVALIITVCDALQHAHEQGIIHRDLKPDNILLDASGVPHITDFGLARRESQMAATERCGIMGTAAYMSPEQARGESDRADCRSDIFSIGVVLFEMLTGERPFRGSVHHVLQQILSKDPPPPRSFDPRIPSDLETICLKCLEKDPTRRYPSAIELSEDLQRFHRREPIQARPVSAAGRLLRWSQRNPSIPLLSLSLMVVTIVCTWASIRFLDSEVEAMQRGLTSETEEPLELLAVVAAEDANATLELRFDQVRKLIDDMQDNPNLLQELAEWNAKENEPRKETLGQLRNSWDQTEDGPAAFRSIQLSLDQVLGQAKPELKTYSFFVCDRTGCQVARSPKRETLGTNFAYRSYFTGLEVDVPSEESPEHTWDRTMSQPRLSDSFVADNKDEAWVVAVSAPIWYADEFQGVAGIFIELKDLIRDLPSVSSNDGQRSLSVFDTRRGHANARCIHYQTFGEREDAPDDRSTVEPSFPVGNEDVYADPIYVGQWRMSIKPIELSDESRRELYVLIQENAERIKVPGNNLRRNLVLIGLSVVVIAACVLTTIWVIILRRVVQT